MELHLLKHHRDSMITPPALQGIQVELSLRDLIKDVFEEAATAIWSLPVRICNQVSATIVIARRGHDSPLERSETKMAVESLAKTLAEDVVGIAYATLTLGNPARPELPAIEVKALADSGAMHLCLPEHVVIQLEMAEREKREVTMADGSKKLLPYVGPVEVRFGNRRCYVGAVVLGDKVLLGAIPMEDMDLVVRPMTSEVLVNPATPNFASSLAKGMG